MTMTFRSITKNHISKLFDYIYNSQIYMPIQKLHKFLDHLLISIFFCSYDLDLWTYVLQSYIKMIVILISTIFENICLYKKKMVFKIMNVFILHIQLWPWHLNLWPWIMHLKDCHFNTSNIHIYVPIQKENRFKINNISIFILSYELHLWTYDSEQYIKITYQYPKHSYIHAYNKKK